MHPRLRLKRFRETNGLSQSELARRVGCDPSHIHKIELGQRSVGLGVALALEKLTGIPPSEWERARLAS